MLLRRVVASVINRQSVTRRLCTTVDNNLNIGEDETVEAKQNAEEKRKKCDEDEELRDTVLSASLSYVPQFGWTREAVTAGIREVGYPEITSGIIENPGIELIHHHVQKSNESLEENMQVCLTDRGAGEISLFVRQNVEKRLRMNIPYINKWPEALAIMATESPLKSFEYGLDLVDILWNLAGDRSTDINWYTKRMALAFVYKSTELCMINDKSEDFNETWEFLDRRLSDHKNLKSFVHDITDIPNTLCGVASTVRNIVGLRSS